MMISMQKVPDFSSVRDEADEVTATTLTRQTDQWRGRADKEHSGTSESSHWTYKTVVIQEIMMYKRVKI